jgi:hypothetical protein
MPLINRDFLMGALAIIAALFFLHIVQPYNLGFSPDSMAYLEGAKNIKAGNGFTYNTGVLINHWPPLYSFILAILSFITNTDLLYTGKYLHALLIIGVIFIFNRILDELRINRFLSLLMIFLIIISAPFKIYLWQLSEGLFIFLVLSSYYYFVLWLKDRNRKYLIYTAILSSLFFLTRFAGIGFIGAYILFIIYFSIGSKSKKLNNAFHYLIPLILIVVPWLVYAKLKDSGIPDRSITLHMISGKKFGEFISVIKNWFFGTYFAVKSAPFVSILILFEIFKNKKRFLKLIPENFTNYQKSVLVAVGLIISYTAFIFFSSTFFYDAIPFDNRILIPIFPFLIIIIAALLQLVLRHNFRLIFFSAIAFLFISFTTSGIPVYRDYYENGLGFTQKKWKNSPTLDHISRDKNLIYYTNATELLKLHTDKVGNVFPNNSKKEQLQKIKQELEDKSAQIVIIENFYWPSYLVTKNLILEEFRNFNFVSCKDGVIISGPSIK